MRSPFFWEKLNWYLFYDLEFSHVRNSLKIILKAKWYKLHNTQNTGFFAKKNTNNGAKLTLNEL